MTSGLTRRGVLAATAAVTSSAWLGAACTRVDTPGDALTRNSSSPADGTPPPAAWVGAHHDRGHRLRQAAALPANAAVQRKATVLIVGGGVAGLAAARAFDAQGIDDIALLELEDQPGGNSRGHRLAGMACPMGAHYLPLPTPESREVSDWLHQIGLLRQELGRTVADERHLCHSPQERLFFQGAWSEGLLPPADPGSRSAEQYRLFAQAVRRVQRPAQGPAFGQARAQRPNRAPVFSLPAHRSAWTPELAELDRLTFAHWLAQQGLDDSPLLWYLDYCCRDDYGAGSASVSAWAGLHYFASRHGFHAPGDEGSDGADREAVFTWPEGNAWLVQKLATPLAQRIHASRVVLRATEGRHAVQLLAWNDASQQLEAWTAQQVVLATPLFVAARVLQGPPQALKDAAALLSYAPWLVANVHIDAPLLDRPGAPPSWDSVPFGGQGLGYVDAMHQSLRPHAGPTVLTAYHALPLNERAALLEPDPAPWRDRVLQELALMHPDIHRRAQRVDLTRWGHAMAVPRPGVQRHPALVALRQGRGRVRFAHADLAGCSVFEEAFTAGCEVALPLRRAV